MAIDPMLYQKLSGRKGDLHTRMGETLAKGAKIQQERDEMPKGFKGAWRVMRRPGMYAQLYYAIKALFRTK